MKNVTITYKGKKYTFESNTSLYEISKNFKNDFKNSIMVGAVNGRPVELSYRVTYDCKIDFYDYTSPIGNVAYENGMIFILIYVLKSFFDIDIIVNYSIDKGILLKTSKNITKNMLDEINKKIKEVISADMLIEKKLINRIEAIKYYKTLKEMDKINILRYTTNTNINLYKLGNMYDYFFSYLPISTGTLNEYSITIINPRRLVLSIPNIFHGNKIEKYKHHEKIFNLYELFSSWCEKTNLINISNINDRISHGDYKDLILLNEMHQNSNLLHIATNIIKNKKIKLVLMAGPSSSGKTTVSRKLKLYLRGLGYKTLSLSIDDFYLDREKTPKKEDGTYDFESIDAIDIKLFNKTLSNLLNGKKVKLPKYNFILGKKEYITDEIKLEDNQLIIIEGLHTLNDKLTSEISKENKYKIYLSPLTVLNLDNHNRVRTTDNRLLRRIARDNRTRGYNASKTLKTWFSVREGEENNIFKYQDEADEVYNTALLYEINALKTYVEPLLYSVNEDDECYSEAVRLLNLLKNVLPIPSDFIPSDSVIREFIGDSYFKGE